MLPFAASEEVNLTQTRQLNGFLSHLISKPEGFKIFKLFECQREMCFTSAETVRLVKK